MYICICNAVTDSQIREALDDGATSIADLNKTLSVGSCCGKPTRSARQIIKQYRSGMKIDELSYNAM
ncbi:(2Fe-2S)-binding protein [Neptunomonas japonica]|uniref:Bacterioferritin-associated ferredoxin n=1 Tax=Neptunomonas japonica JAMM 1380 TaxID=1441457 RepID=A0A7R6PID3_9GAMM|nr:(2Fe-2S)-binding protein [Neptunomonas japonica]BBB30757.1 bacterioferritin-associated ferredoxin [Neptunomonas japonica JAMM 1380]